MKIKDCLSGEKSPHLILESVFMKHKYFLFPILFLAFIASCADNPRESQDNTQNSNTPIFNRRAENSNANSNQANQSEAKTAESPAEVPIYENADTAFEAGRKFFDQNEDEKAVRAFEQAVKLDSSVAEAHFHLAVAYDLLEEKEKAQKSYAQAIKIYQKQTAKNPKDAAGYFSLGRALNKIGDDQKAQKALQQAVKLEPEDSEYHYELGSVLIKLAQYSEAVKELKKALEIDPENARATDALEKAEAGNARVQSARTQNKNSR